MSNSINVALDELIVRNRRGGQRNGNGGGRRPVRGGGGAGGRRGIRSDSYYFQEPKGKWKHDKFDSLYGAGAQRRSGGGGPIRARGGRGGGASGGVVKLNISDLPETVLTSDLEELFSDFNIYGVTVHYNEGGEHLGTADLFVSSRAAKEILREYANIAIDGQEIKIGVVDESGGSLSSRARIQDRIRHVANNPIRRRKAVAASKPGGGRRASAGRGVSKAGGGGVGGGAAGGAAKPKKPMTTEELDKELEAYMGSRHPQITM